MKEKIKKIPILGKIIYALYNIVRINNLKFISLLNKEHLERQACEIKILSSKIEILSSKIEMQNKEIKELYKLNEDLKKTVSLNIVHISDSLEMRMDQFIFDSKINSKNSNDK